MIGSVSWVRVGAWAAAGAALLVLFLMWKAEHARAAMYEVTANVAKAQYEHAVRERLRLREASEQFEQALIKRERRIEEIRAEAVGLERDLRRAREDASEAYQECMLRRVPDTYLDRLRAHLRGRVGE